MAFAVIRPIAILVVYQSKFRHLADNGLKFEPPLVRRRSVEHFMHGFLIWLYLTSIQIITLVVAEGINDAHKGVCPFLCEEILSRPESLGFVFIQIAVKRILKEFHTIGYVVGMDVFKLARQKGGMGNTASTGEQIVEMRRLWE